MLLKRRLIGDGILKRIEINVKEKTMPPEYKSIRCKYCSLGFENRCNLLGLCNIFNYPSSQYPPRKYAYVV